MNSNTKEKIVILNVMQFSDKKTGEMKSRLEFIFADPDKKQNKENCKGKFAVSCFYNGNDVFRDIPIALIEEVVTATFRPVVSKMNPLRSNSIIESIEFKGNVITLLQS